MKIFNYYFSSDARITGSAINNANFNIDWSAMDETKKYIGRLSLFSRNMSGLLSDDIVCIEANLNVQNNIFRSVSTSTSYGSTNIIAVAPAQQVGTSNVIRLKYTDCPPFYIMGRPMNPFLTIALKDPSDNLITTTNPWYGVLSFEEVDE